MKIFKKTIQLFLILMPGLYAQAQKAHKIWEGNLVPRDFEVFYKENYTIVSGDISIINSDLKDLASLSNLMGIEGSLRIEKNKNIKSLDGLENIVGVDSDIEITENKSLTDISALNNLESCRNLV
ncbi:hypothetical protein, partial [Xanthovirga aplysinae]|uniref:hypothetical protein n=1 Tax=Xanthovirga aplysinae TaxID=2529853 RepID=UPI003CCCA389|nr:hypothetical protein [Xanthovirga aplysinae]